MGESFVHKGFKEFRNACCDEENLKFMLYIEVSNLTAKEDRDV